MTSDLPAVQYSNSMMVAMFASATLLRRRARSYRQSFQPVCDDVRRKRARGQLGLPKDREKRAERNEVTTSRFEPR